MAEASSEGASPIEGSTKVEELEMYLKENGIVPSEEQARSCSMALFILTRTMLGNSCREIIKDAPVTFISDTQGVTLLFAAIGAYALGCWDASAPIMCSMAGTPSEETFYSLALQKLRRNSDITLLGIDETGSTMFRINVKGFEFRIQYHQSPFTKSWIQVSNCGLEEDIPLGPTSKRRFNVYRDTLHLRSMIADRKAFALAYLAVKLWAQHHGVFSEDFGLLDEPTLLFMVAEASYLPDTMQPASDEMIVSSFFNYFGSLELTDVITGNVLLRAKKPLVRSQFGQGMAVRSCHSPAYNLSNVKTAACARIIQSEIQKSKLLMQGLWHWETLLGKAQKQISDGIARDSLPPPAADTPFSTYLDDKVYSAFIKIEAAHWGASIIQKGRYFERVDAIAVKFARKAAMKESQAISSRPWPKRLRNQADEDLHLPGAYQRICYLNGLRTNPKPDPSPPNVQSWRADFEALEAVLREDVSELETRLINDKSHDCASSMFTVRILPRGELGETFIEDDRKWGPLPIDEADLPDETDDDLDTIEDRPPPTKLKFNRATRQNRKEFEGVSAEMDIGRSSLRPALDVLNRLRFDNKYDVDDYLIGYEDRHAGIMEVPVTSWKTSDNTLEDFIPQSRIVYYKRKTDEVEVWNRRKRLDTVFGSGARQQE